MITLPKNNESLLEAIKIFSNDPIFASDTKFELEDPYRRPLPIDPPIQLDFASPIDQKSIYSHSSLIGHALLRTIYELDLLILPSSSSLLYNFKSFYNEKSKILGDFIKPYLEKYLYGFLESHIKISGSWTLESFSEYIDDEIRTYATYENTGAKIIEKSVDPQRAAKHLLIKFAPDTYFEGSALAYRISGAYGREQSELFKILIDEYGYGVHSLKHSSLFLQLLRSCGLKDNLHRYWHYYTPCSLAVHNYFHYVARRTGTYFKYLGHILFSEATFSNTSQQFANTLDNVFNGNIDTTYFTEHAGIDIHHGQMVFKNVVLSSIRKFGNEIIPEILQGYEEYKYLSKLSSNYFESQIAHLDNCNKIQNIDLKIIAIYKNCIKLSIKKVYSNIFDNTTRIVVKAGELCVSVGYGLELILRENQCIAINQHQLIRYMAKVPNTSICFTEYNDI